MIVLQAGQLGLTIADWSSILYLLNVDFVQCREFSRLFPSPQRLGRPDSNNEGQDLLSSVHPITYYYLTISLY
jgi:hypothetical protein